MSTRLLLATRNAGKLAELQRLLEAAVPGVAVVGLRDVEDYPEAPETGATFAENARLKALYYHEHTGLPAVADDSGIEIDALDKAPGVHSARWHGTDYAVKFQAIYRELAARGLATSTARFVAHVALADRGMVQFEAAGSVEGTIAPAPRGTHGFGYDPIFLYPPYGCTLAEVDGDRKAAVSHRGAAFRQLAAWLANLP